MLSRWAAGIGQRPRKMVRKQADLSKDEIELLGDPESEEVFSGSHEDLKHAAQQLHFLRKTSRCLTYLKVSLLNPLLPLQSGTSSVKHALRTRYKVS